ncbi:MAG: M20/M25/M40 family metallo-hydrolase, partial [Myxococcota bacterium]
MGTQPSPARGGPSQAHRAIARGIAVALLAALCTACPASSPQIQAPPPPVVELDAPRIARHLSEAIRQPTISLGNPEAFEALRAWLPRAYPHVYAALEVEEIGRDSLLMHWRGSDPKRSPYALLAHLDVVPVEAGSETLWEHPPFSGAVAAGYVWGRGAIDDKGPAIAMLEAIESLLEAGQLPPRSFYLALGGDEEVGGEQGAGAIASALESRGV